MYMPDVELWSKGLKFGDVSLKQGTKNYRGVEFVNYLNDMYVCHLNCQSSMFYILLSIIFSDL